MNFVSIKRLVLSLILTLGSVMTLPAYAWPDTDEMNMCGAAVKNVRSYAGEFRGWAAHDIYVSARGLDHYFRHNCPEVKATKNYKGKNWTPAAKMSAKAPARKKMHKKRVHKKHMKKHMKKAMKRVKNKSADCIAVDRLNSTGPVVTRANHRRTHVAGDNFMRDARAVLNMGKAKKHKRITKKSSGDSCIVTDGLNTRGAAVRVVRR